MWNVKNLLQIQRNSNTTPKLAFANFQKLFKLLTDACNLGLGAILYQTENKVGRLTGYAS